MKFCSIRPWCINFETKNSSSMLLRCHFKINTRTKSTHLCGQVRIICRAIPACPVRLVCLARPVRSAPLVCPVCSVRQACPVRSVCPACTVRPVRPAAHPSSAHLVRPAPRGRPAPPVRPVPPVRQTLSSLQIIWSDWSVQIVLSVRSGVLLRNIQLL